MSEPDAVSAAAVDAPREMPSWFRPVLGLLLLANAVAVVGVLIDFVTFPPSPSFDRRHLLPFFVSLILVVVAWRCGRRARLGSGIWSVVAHTTLAAGIVLTLAGFASGPWPRRALGGAVRSESVTILAVNDVYRIEGLDGGKTGGLARLRTIRAQLEHAHPGRVLLLHGGDAISPSFLSRKYKGKQMIDVLNLMDGDPRPGHLDERMFVVLGNHEFDDEDCSRDSVLQKRVAQSDFYWLDGTISLTPCPGGGPRLVGGNVLRGTIVEIGRLKVGLFGLTVDPEKQSRGVYALDPHGTALALVTDLRRRGAEVVIAVTHLNWSDDLRLYRVLRDLGLDLVIGGHDHVSMSLPKGAAEPRIFKADADAATAWIVTLTRHADGHVTVRGQHQALRQDVAKDPLVDRSVDTWLRKHAAAFCQDAAKDPHWVGAKPDPLTCLDERLGVTETAFVASEELVRSRETSAGDWIADEMVAAFATCGVDAGFINAGVLRLNQDLTAGSNITRRHLEELIGFPTALRVYKVRHDKLKKALANAVSKPDSGRWLQVSDQLAFTYRPGDSQEGAAAQITKAVVRPSGKAPIEITESPTATVRIVTTEYLQKDPTDGFDQILPPPDPTACAASGSDLKEILYRALQKQGRIKPEPQGRICTETEARQRPCRADEWVKSR
jgi:2',3'-cyclic-nucleotide 2'-phosphodiesterase (5'-nucleotidase family)